MTHTALSGEGQVYARQDGGNESISSAGRVHGHRCIKGIERLSRFGAFRRNANIREPLAWPKTMCASMHSPFCFRCYRLTIPTGNCKRHLTERCTHVCCVPCASVLLQHKNNNNTSVEHGAIIKKPSDRSARSVL